MRYRNLDTHGSSGIHTYVPQQSRPRPPVPPVPPYVPVVVPVMIVERGCRGTRERVGDARLQPGVGGVRAHVRRPRDARPIRSIFLRGPPEPVPLSRPSESWILAGPVARAQARGETSREWRELMYFAYLAYSDIHTWYKYTVV